MTRIDKPAMLIASSWIAFVIGCTIFGGRRDDIDIPSGVDSSTPAVFSSSSTDQQGLANTVARLDAKINTVIQDVSGRILTWGFSVSMVVTAVGFLVYLISHRSRRLDRFCSMLKGKPNAGDSAGGQRRGS